MKELSATAVAVRDAALKNLASDDIVASNGVAKDQDSSLYYTHAEQATALKPDQIDLLKSYEQSFVAGIGAAVAAVGLEAVVKDPAIKKTEATFKGASGEEFSVVYTPVKKGTTPGQNGDEPKAYTSYGGVRVTHRTTTESKGGDIGIIMQMAAEATAAALSGKS